MIGFSPSHLYPVFTIYKFVHGISKGLSDTAAIVAEIAPRFPEGHPTKVKRFSPLHWLLHSCCNIATTDDTDELFHTLYHLSAQVENLQLAVHNEHRNVIQAVSNMEELTKQFNTITGEEEMNFPR
ncbi:uncharacterized protein LOC113468140 isoform X2 [Diaphorina citri]|uniref:Uncharacterized protein LOC113468140 isoform X1 n=1 Tax=Diaphorina citri TaxID=121845 RepID=A0A3Q0IWI4_DIACI|nr:uncharacterized protein LOC113468140 isoform X1 [Diaphorina citri]XP_026680633.1 uncharacterized protein LOC113468140 isoform X2 [Diaphorina citri]